MNNKKMIIYIIIFAIFFSSIFCAKELSIDEKNRFKEEIKNGNVEYIELFLNKRKDLNINNENQFGYIPLHVAVEANNIPVIDLLLRYGADINKLNKCKQNALYLSNNIVTLKHIIKKGASLNIVDCWGETPLSNAIKNYEVAKLFIDSGADVNFTDEDGLSILHLAISANNIELVKYLIELKKINTTLSNDIIKWYVIVNCRRNEIEKEMLAELVKTGISIDIQDANLNTVLHTSCILKCKKPLIKLLLDKGARKDVKNAKGQTPYDIAVEKGLSRDILQLLK